MQRPLFEMIAIDSHQNKLHTFVMPGLVDLYGVSALQIAT